MKSRQIQKHEFYIGDKKVDVYPGSGSRSAVIYLNTFAGEGDKVYQVLRSADSPDFTLVAVSGLDWNHDMAPWDIPPISEGHTPCTGGAGDYLQLLTERIMPQAEKLAPDVSWRGLAGYSLAGLFAVYSLYQTDLFSRIASMSGSLWFPGFLEYAASHEMKRLPDCAYFSIGDRENRTRNPYLKTVRENTEKMERLCAESGIHTFFQLNQGNHYKNAAQRTAAGIAWLLNR